MGRVPRRHLLGAMLLLLLAGPVPATAPRDSRPAEQDGQSVEQLLPFQNLVSDRELKRDFFRMEFTPLGDSSLAMFFLVPRDWQSRALRVSPKTLRHDDRQLVPLVLVTSPGMRARIEVGYVRVPARVTLERWVQEYLAGNKLPVLKRQLGNFSGRAVVDVLVRRDKQEVSRMTFSRHGQRIIVFSCTTAERAYEDFARTCGIATVSFQMKS